MKKKIIIIIFSILTIGILYVLYIALNLYTGWYGYGYWKYRIHSLNINESKERNVFVKELNYKIDEPSLIENFYIKPYIERGYKSGINDENETHIIKNSKYPYNLNFEWKNNPYGIKDKSKYKDAISVSISKDDLIKIDSSDAVWGYLEHPYLKDTITLEYSDFAKKHKGKIKVW